MIAPKFIRVGITVLIGLVGIIFFSLILGSCTSGSSPGIQDIFLIQIGNGHGNSSSNFIVRTGYFGVCAGTPGRLDCSTGAGNWTNWQQAPAAVKPYVEFGVKIRDSIFFPYAVIIATAGFIIGTSLAVVNQLRLNRSPLLERLILGSLGLALFLSFIATIAVSYAKSALVLAGDTIQTNFVVTGGNTIYIFHWLVFGFTAAMLLLNLEVVFFRLKDRLFKKKQTVV
jgi:hypothetical protein